ncbi:MAG: NADP-dependent oxidoreductase [Pseudomonadota bacterium]
MINRKIVLVSRPDGYPKVDDFKLIEESVPELGDDQVLLAAEHLSIDAFIQTTLDGDPGFHGTMELNTPVVALGVARVVESRFDGLNQGDAVFGPIGAQTHLVGPGNMFRKLQEDAAPARAYLGALGMTTGLTAYAGMISVGEVAQSDTVAVSAAAGAVGSVACQLARIKGAKVIGIAGGPEKVDYVVNTLGCDAGIDYKSDDVRAKLAELAPDGINVFFDNVGGEILDDVLDNITKGARVVICGAISQYDDLSSVRGPNLYLRLAERNSSMRGFTVDTFAADFPAMEADIAGWMSAGELTLPEHIVEGIDNFPEALTLLFNGGHKGKLLVAP